MRKKANEWDEQRPRVGKLGAVGLDERIQPRIKRLRAHLGVDFVAQPSPLIDRAFEVELLGAFHRAIDGDPRHDFRVCEMLRAAASFPNSLVRLPPNLLQLVRERDLEAPRGPTRWNSADVRLVKRVHHLAEDVQLELLVRRVTDAHRTRTFITRKPRELPLPEKTLAGKA